MSGRYTVVFTAVGVTVQQDFWEINGAAGKVLAVHSIRLSQSSDVGDAAAEGLQIDLVTGNATSGSGGTAPTPAPLEGVGNASSFTAEVNNTTKASTGTAVTKYSWNWVIQGPFVEQFTPVEMPYIEPSGRLCIRLSTTPADSLTISGTMVLEELF